MVVIGSAITETLLTIHVCYFAVCVTIIIIINSGRPSELEGVLHFDHKGRIVLGPDQKNVTLLSSTYCAVHLICLLYMTDTIIYWYESAAS